MIRKDDNFISAVCYLNNDEDKISFFLESIYNILDAKFKKFELIFVDDASSDRSVEIVKEFSKDKPISIQVIKMSFYQGIEASMNVGVDLAIGDFIYEFNSLEIDYHQDKILELYNGLLTGYELAVLSPKKSDHLSSTIFYNIFNMFRYSKTSIKPQTVSLTSRRTYNKVTSISEFLLYRTATYAGLGIKIYTIEYDCTKDKAKHTREKISNRIDLASNSLILFTSLGSKLSIGISIAFLLFFLLLGFYSVSVYFSGSPVEGWTTLMVFLSIAFFGLFALLAIVIKYLSLLLRLTYNKQHYFYEKVDKLSKN